MKNRVFYTDTNLFGIKELKLFLESGFSYYVGNIVDLKYSPFKKKSESKIKEIKKFAGNKYVSGDRELTVKNLYHKTEDNILITYGDDIFNKKRSMRRPFSCFTFGFIYSFLNKVFRKRKPSGFDITLIAQMALRKKCHTIVLSYFNNKRLIDFEYNNIRIVILPKGRCCIFV